MFSVAYYSSFSRTVQLFYVLDVVPVPHQNHQKLVSFQSEGGSLRWFYQ